MYNPTEYTRQAVAAKYDNEYNYSLDCLPATADDYTAEGPEVTLKPYGTTYLVVTLQEAREAGLIFTDSDTTTYDGRKWIVVLN